MPLRSAPYLWVQLINGGALPLEALLLLLLLAGADPGPVPTLERLLAWALGAAAPALLLWHRPADPRSLLLLSGTAPGINLTDAEIAGFGRMRVPRVAFAVGVVVLLPLLSWLDGMAALASQLSPLQGTERLLCLMAASGLLALMVWQWQQLVQAIWLLTQNLETESSNAAPAPADSARMARNLGLPLLRWPSLEWPAQPERPSPRDWELKSSTSNASETTVDINAESATGNTVDINTNIVTDIEFETEINTDRQSVTIQTDGMPSNDAQCDGVKTDGHQEARGMETKPPEVVQADEVDQEVLEAEVIDPLDSTVALPVEPEQTGEHDEGHDLDQQIG